MGHDVFISYSHKDKRVADAACALLERRGNRCWIAPRDVGGGEWAKAIVDAIRGARVFVLIFSANANRSPQVNREVERAVNNGLPVIPFRIEDVTPSDSLEYFISNQHWLDALNPPMERHLDYLGDVVGRVLGGADKGPAAQRHPEVPPPPAPTQPGWRLLGGLLLLALLVAGMIAYVLAGRGGAAAAGGANNLVAGNDVVPPVENRTEPAPARLVAQPLRPWINFVAIHTSPDLGSFVDAPPLLRAAGIPATAEGVTPAGAQLEFVDPRAMGGETWFAQRNLLVLEIPARSPASFTLRFDEPIAEIRLVRPSFGATSMTAATADMLNYPGFTVTAFGNDNQPVDRQRRDPINRYYGAGAVAADTITLRAAEGMILLRFDADDAIMRTLGGSSTQRAFYALMFESVMVRRMPQPAAPVPAQ